MEPMDVEGPTASSPPSSRPPQTKPPVPFGGTAQVFRPAPTPLSINGTQSPFQSKSMSAAPPPTSSTYRQTMPACGAASPFTEGPIKSVPAPGKGIAASPFTVNPNSAAGVFSKAAPSKRVSLPIPKAEPRPVKDALMSSSSTPNASSSSLPTPAIDLSSYTVIPESIPALTPSYPATLFGGLSADDEHVTVWEPRTGKTVAGNAAPYRRNLSTWLETHQGWEEKADELKSSKRRAAARRSKHAATCFASLCAFPIAKTLSEDALKQFEAAKVPTPTGSLSDWSPDDYVRLQEILFRVARDGHMMQRESLPTDRWERVVQNLGANKKRTDVLYLSHHMLQFGIQKSQHELMVASGSATPSGQTNAIGIPGRSDNGTGLSSPASASYGSFDQSNAWRGPGSFGASSLPAMGSGGLSAITNSFRTPKEPRITVWHPDTGKTISGNAAPCRRNLEAWMAQHPGWLPKAETQLSSSRRTRNKKGRPMSVPSNSIAIYGGNNNTTTQHSYGRNSPEDDAIQGLLGLGSVGSFGSLGAGGSLLMASGIGKRSQSLRQKKSALTSSVSSSSAGDGDDTDSSDDEDVEPMKMDTR